MWLEGYEYTDIEHKTGHSGFRFEVSLGFLEGS